MGKEQWFVVGVIVAVIFFIILLFYVEHVKLKRRIEWDWGKIPQINNNDQEESLELSWKITSEMLETKSQIDDLTWYDLDMIRIFELLNGTKSSIGSEYLYYRLRAYDFSEEKLNRLDKLVQFFSENDGTRQQMQYQFSKIGKRDKNFVVDYLVDPLKKQLKHTKIYTILGILPLIWLVLLFVNLQAGVMGLVFSLIVNTAIYYKQKNKIEKEFISMNYLVTMIYRAEKIGKIAFPFQVELQKLSTIFHSISSLGISFRGKTGSEMEMILESINILFLLPFITYNKVLKKLNKNHKDAKKLWELLGEIDMSMAVLNTEKCLPYYCQAEFAQEGNVQAKSTYHPLLSHPVANDVDWRNTTLVTGSNASGKSTYVKSVAINAILAQTIGISCARSFQLPHSHVLTSMAIEDDLFEGDSYFVAEIKSVKRIIEKVQSQEMCLCFIDEILKGTNTIERIAASSSIVHWLNQFASLVFIATHDIELTEILKQECDNIHFRETVTEENGIEFDYQLHQGPANTRNAIALLKVMKYPVEIIRKAQSEADYFTKKKAWQVIEKSDVILK